MQRYKIPQITKIITQMITMIIMVQRIWNKKTRYRMDNESCFWWALTDSNRRPSACKADALNQLS